MADIELVIKIPEENYDNICNNETASRYSVLYALDGIRKGTPLPKGHGRLIDADEIQFENNEFDTYRDYSRAFDTIDYAPTIIEADESEGKE